MQVHARSTYAMNGRNRRQWLREVAAGTVASSLPSPAGAAPTGEFQLFWGDLHNHNAVGYAQGSLERTYEIARSHLDFFAFTPHAQWHDMPQMPNNAHEKWVKGFAVTREQWPKVCRLAAAGTDPGKFAAFLGYEWHSSRFGDYCVYYPGDEGPLAYFDDVRKLQEHARSTGAILIPHHIAYKRGWRGADFGFFDPGLSPVIEIYSEHGLSERDQGPCDYITHSNGGRWTRNTLLAAFRKGIRAGLIASSDDHLGFPGAYGEGLAGIYAKELTRASLFEALRARRTLAVTGDRIGLLFKLNGQWMGATLPFAGRREIEVTAEGKGEIERIEVIRNGRAVHRHFPEDHAPPQKRWPGEALCRIEFGWGPWGALAMTRVCDWDFTATLHAGKLLAATPCFQSGPFEEDRRSRILSRNENSCRLQSYTSRREAYREIATNAVILHLAGGPEAELEVALTRPARMTFRKKLGELAKNNEIEFTGPFTSESMLIHRLVTPALYRASFRFTDRGRRGQTDWYYVRVTQVNGHMAWSSPVWVEG